MSGTVLMLLTRGAMAVVPADDRLRIDRLIALMTIEEKAGQLTLLADPFRWRPTGVNPGDTDGLDTDQARIARLIRAGRLGALFNGVGAEAGRSLQRLAVEESRLGIPLLFAADIIHGLRTIFPVPLAEAASWDPELARRIARAAAREAAASGIHQTFAPMVDIGRDQRWGRVVEGAGEDVLLGRLFAQARVRGFQSDDLTRPDALLATPKHFAAYGAAEAGLDYAGVEISLPTLREDYLPPFEAAFAAGAGAVMSAFHELNGVPATGNRWLLTDLLRRQLGFAGFVVADYTADAELVAHGVAKDERDAARIAFLAGVDMSMQSGLYLRYLPDLVAAGEVPLALVDAAVRRVLAAKAALGLFRNPYRGTDPETERRVLADPAQLALAREAGRRSAVLLKNQGDLLPLPKGGRRIALIGPFGDDRANLFGPWSIFADPERAVTIADGLRRAMADPAQLRVEPGSGVEEPLPGGIQAAVAAAEAADIVVLAIGESAAMSAEAQSRAEIVVPPAQQALAEAVAAAGRPIVVLLKTGRALALSGAVRDAQAVLVTWFLGSEEGHAVADLLFGDHAPSGRLPVSFPHYSGQEPFYYSRKPTGRPERADDHAFKARFRETANRALYPFGHGLTYAPVRYGELRVEPAHLPWDGELTVTARLRNDGSRPAEEVAQLYVRDRVARLTRPVRLLTAFTRVTIPPGGEAEARFTLRRQDLEYVGPDLQPTVEPGEFDLWVAPDAEHGLQARFTLLA
ncbi:MAG TPA: glycoside hydrolase family 3 N-terminal domain-containing protein [Geminicoccus sp.]|uniref:glycoside hydrolase family 3 N-terminal domain-containing protein n=1 Tax=Geminicoccus sp. TaxID=2024832 RepID=UPI002C8468E3|nr:glycoside hydrolase family 3 N-terminal domain-containing protein [Geminicoccus sp.]HWL68470.1 glycoside hydrolase family 3 N-terminal domain-containing protein [Geminicoccus sp.]